MSTAVAAEEALHAELCELYEVDDMMMLAYPLPCRPGYTNKGNHGSINDIMDVVPAELTWALQDGDFDRAATVACSAHARAVAAHAERTAARREPAVASRVFTLLAIALQKQGMLCESVALLEYEAEIARALAEEAPDCPPADCDVIDKCLVRPDQEQVACRDTCRNELFDLYGIHIGSSVEVAKAIDRESKRDKKKRRRQATEDEEPAPDDLENLKGRVDAVEQVLRREARRLLIRKLIEDNIRVSLPGESPFPDGSWIALRGEEGFHGTDAPGNPVRKAFTDLLKKLHRVSFGVQKFPAARDNMTMRFEDTLWSVQWRNIARSVAVGSHVAASCSRNDSSAIPASNSNLNMSSPETEVRITEMTFLGECELFVSLILIAAGRTRSGGPPDLTCDKSAGRIIARGGVAAER